MPQPNFMSTFVHRYLRVPYTLNVEVFQAPKKPKATYVLVHGIGNSLHSWDQMVKRMPNDVKIIGVDLLGFGKSAKPQWAKYNAKTQARSLAITLINLRLKQRPILVGHSLGALVSVEVAKRYPMFVKELVLCSPPFYRPELAQKKGLKPQEDVLRNLYRFAAKRPDRLAKLTPVAVRVGLANTAINLSEDHIPSYLATLEASVINQTSLQDIEHLKLPIMIFYGALDPVVVGKHIVKLGKEHANITTKKLLAGHEVISGYAGAVAKWIERKTFTGSLQDR